MKLGLRAELHIVFCESKRLLLYSLPTSVLVFSISNYFPALMRYRCFELRMAQAIVCDNGSKPIDPEGQLAFWA